MRTLLLTCLMTGLSVFSAGTLKAQSQGEGQIAFAYADATTSIGTGKIETYHVAIRVQDDALVGTEVIGLRIPMDTKTDATDLSGWLTSELKVQSKQNVVDGQQKSVDKNNIKDGFIDLVFDTPYTLTAKGIYAGYSFTILSKDNEASAYPLRVGSYVSDDAFYLFTNKTYMKWKSYAEKAECASALQVILSGGRIVGDAASVVSIDDVNIQTGTKTKTRVTIANHGYNGVKSLDFTYTIGGQEFSKSLKLSPALKNIYGAQSTFSIDIPAMEAQAAYDLQLTLTKVNGQDNADAVASGKGHVYAFNLLPKHRAVLEEYTGCWCGWCPRGFVGLEEMNRLYPEDFIGIAYHNGDAMAYTSDYPSDVAGFPCAWLDRVKETDAYGGDAGSSPFGIDKTWLARCQTLAPADIEVVAGWADEAKTVLRAVSYTTSPLPVEDCKYQLSYVLVADGLTGEGSNWTQSNYYAGQSGWGTQMEMFTKAEKQVEGLTFNDVIVDRSGKGGIEGSLPQALEAETPISHTFDFNIARNSIIQDKEKLRVVVLLLDPQTGVILNANKTSAIRDNLNSVLSTKADAPVESIRYFDLFGRRVTLPCQGIVLQQTRHTDGSVTTSKHLFGK